MRLLLIMEALSPLVHLAGLSITSFCFTYVASSIIGAWRREGLLTWSQVALQMVYINSWLFFFTSGIFSYELELHASKVACTIGNMLCLILYVSSTMSIYALHIEKCYKFWNETNTLHIKPKLHKVYIFLMVPIFGILIATLAESQSYLVENSACKIAVVPAFDLLLLALNTLLWTLIAGAFSWIFLRSRPSNSSISYPVQGHVIAAMIGLIIAIMNVVALGVMHRDQPGWMYLVSSASEVLVNVVIVTWLYRPYFNIQTDPKHAAASDQAFQIVPSTHPRDSEQNDPPEIDRELQQATTYSILSPTQSMHPVTRQSIPIERITSKFSLKQVASVSYLSLASSWLSTYTPSGTGADSKRAKKQFVGRLRAATLPTNPFTRYTFRRSEYAPLTLPVSGHVSRIKLPSARFGLGRGMHVSKLGALKSIAEARGDFLETNYQASKKPILLQSPRSSRTDSTVLVIPSLPCLGNDDEANNSSYTEEDLKAIKAMSQLPYL